MRTKNTAPERSLGCVYLARIAQTFSHGRARAKNARPIIGLKPIHTAAGGGTAFMGIKGLWLLRRLQLQSARM